MGSRTDWKPSASTYRKQVYRFSPSKASRGSGASRKGTLRKKRPSPHRPEAPHLRSLPSGGDTRRPMPSALWSEREEQASPSLASSQRPHAEDFIGPQGLNGRDGHRNHRNRFANGVEDLEDTAFLVAACFRSRQVVDQSGQVSAAKAFLRKVSRQGNLGE